MLADNLAAPYKADLSEFLGSLLDALFRAAGSALLCVQLQRLLAVLGWRLQMSALCAELCCLGNDKAVLRGECRSMCNGSGYLRFWLLEAA